MANNRLYIRCKICGECFFIGKHFGDALKTSVMTIEGLNEFYAQHHYCSGQSDKYRLELCEEFPTELTDNHFDCDGKYII